MAKRNKGLGSTSSAELLKVKKEDTKNNPGVMEESLEKDLQHTDDPLDNLAQGEDIFHIEYSVSYSYSPSDKFGDFTGSYYSFPITWNEIFGAIAPTLANGAKEQALVEPLNFLITKVYERNFGDRGLFKNFCILKESFHTILIQMRALQLITDASDKRKFWEDDQYWKLTKIGEELMLKVRSVKKPSSHRIKNRSANAVKANTSS